MRLICPNCDAQYEVSDDAIPPEGRDVQCSNCGHGWFQRSSAFVAAQPTIPATVAEPDAAWRAGAWPQTDPAPFPAPEPFLRPRPEPADPAPTPSVEPAPSVDAEPALGPDPIADVAAARPADPLPPEDEDQEPPPAPAVAPPSRSLDGSLLAMLREEAARETEQRRQEGVVPTPPVAVPAPPDAGPADDSPVPVPGPVLAEPMPRPRRDLLPDIEEINSTLRTATARPAEPSDVAPEAPRPSRAPYRAGFFLMILAALLLATGYLMAPQIAAEMPGAEPALRTYVAAVDEARMLLDRLLRAALTALQGAAA